MSEDRQPELPQRQPGRERFPPPPPDVPRDSGGLSADSRSVVLGRIRRALADRPMVDVPRDYRRVGGHEPGSPGVLDLLAERLLDYRATVRRCAADDVGEAVAAALAARGATRVAVPDGLPEGWLSPARAAGVALVGDDPPLAADALDALDGVLTSSVVAVADTGTIVLDGSAGMGRRALSLVPDYHLCVVLASDVVEIVPESLPRLQPDRPLTMISGPSATSDIELDRVEGVHGPRTIEVVLAS